MSEKGEDKEHVDAQPGISYSYCSHQAEKSHVQQLQKQLTGRERREIVCVKCIHQDWLRAAQTSASLEVEARPGVLPAACCHPAYSYARWICVQQQRSSQRRFSGWVAWQGGMG